MCREYYYCMKAKYVTTALGTVKNAWSWKWRGTSSKKLCVVPLWLQAEYDHGGKYDGRVKLILKILTEPCNFERIRNRILAKYLIFYVFPDLWDNPVKADSPKYVSVCHLLSAHPHLHMSLCTTHLMNEWMSQPVNQSVNNLNESIKHSSSREGEYQIYM
jgi:hypothetical protein